MRPLAIMRADDTGDSYSLSQFCISAEPSVWQAFVQQELANDDALTSSADFRAGLATTMYPGPVWGAAAAVDTPDDIVADLSNPFLAGAAIAYLPAAFAHTHHVTVAAIQNASAAFVQPNDMNVRAGLQGVQANPDGTLTMSDPIDPNAYEPPTLAYALVPTTVFDPDRGATMTALVCDAMTSGGLLAAVPAERAAEIDGWVVGGLVDGPAGTIAVD